MKYMIYNINIIYHNYTRITLRAYVYITTTEYYITQ